MPKFNIDEIQQLSEPIEIVLEGEQYVVTKISTELMDQVTEISKGSAEEKNILPRQLGLLLGVDPAKFMKTDVRKLGKAIKYITEEVVKGLETKNA